MKKVLVFAMLLFMILGVASAVDVDSSDADTSATSNVVSNDVVETQESSLQMEDDVEDNTDPGANPTQYNNLTDGQTYNNAIITLNDSQAFTDATVTFNNNVTLTSDSTTKTLTNLKVVITGTNVTINNVNFNHQTTTDTKVIDVTSTAGDVLINNTDIALTKNNAATTMAISVSGSTGSVVVNNSDIVVNAYPQGLWHQDENENWYNQLKVSGIAIDQASNVDVLNTTVKLTATAADSVGATMPAITIKDQSNNINITNNTINSTGATYNYGIMCADYVNNLNVNYNNVNVTGIQYNAGMDISTSVNSNVKYNNITVNSTNTSVLSSGNEALAYGIILATYNTNNTDNNVSYNNIDLIANVGYGIENYMGSQNKIDNNNITINAKRALGIATSSSNNNQYTNNIINITCNQENINYFYETIPTQNVGILIINGSTNTISNNKINITETSNDENPTSTAYAIILDEDSEDNEGSNNQLFIYLNDVLISSHLIKDEGSNSVTYTTITTNSLNKNKIVKKDEEIIIDDNNCLDYGSNNGTLQLSVSNGSYFITLRREDINQIRLTSVNSNLNLRFDVPNINTIVLFQSSDINITSSYNPSVLLAVQRCTNVIVNDSVFLDCMSAGNTNFESMNTTLISQNDNTFIMNHQQGRVYGITKYYSNYFDTNTHILLNSIPEGSTIIVWKIPRYNFTDPMIINKPINLSSLNNAIYDADITFVAGSEGSNITGLTLNGNLYINTSNINVKNNTIKKTVYINEGSNVVIEENNFDTTETAIIIASGLENTIKNNNITTTSQYTITLDADSAENTITSNTLQAATLTGIASVHDEGEDNKITDGSDEPVVVEPTLKVDTTEFTVGESATITASIYKGEEVDTTINAGKVVFKVNGKTLKDANGKVIYAKVVNGTATIENYTIPTTWNKEGLTISAVYSGSTKCASLRSTAQEITITQTTTPTITTEDITATKADTITLTATITDGTNPVNTGKVVFKVNGKSVKDSNGKVIYAKVTNGTVSVEYTIPESMKTKNYTITAVFMATDYEKLEDTKTLTVSN